MTRTVQKKNRRRLPATPERDVVEKPRRRSKRISDEKPAEHNAQSSPQQPIQAGAHRSNLQSPSPGRGRLLTVEKSRRDEADRRDTKVMQIALPFADTPIQRRNKEMRKTSAEGHRRSSTGMRGKRASSVIDEGRGNGKSSSIFSEPFVLPHLMPLFVEVSEVLSSNGSRASQNPRTSIRLEYDAPDLVIRAGDLGGAQYTTEGTPANSTTYATALPHAEVPATEFYKHISADITEPRRMRSLLGWCGTRLLPSKPHPPPRDTASALSEFQAQQAGKSAPWPLPPQLAETWAAHVIQEELSQSLMMNGTLSDWFSRDESVPTRRPLRKKANPRNLANREKVDELERELER